MLGSVNTYKIAVLVLSVTLIAIVFKIVGSTGLGRISNLEAEIAAQRIESDTLLQRNQLIAEDLQRIKNDDRQVEVLARYHLGMIKPGEVFLLTKD